MHRLRFTSSPVSTSLLGFSILAFGLSACRTSGDLAGGRDNYEDPTEVRTVDASDESNDTAKESGGREARGTSRDASRTEGQSDTHPGGEQSQAEMAVMRGELENARYAATKEQEAMRARIAQLELTNKALADENGALRRGDAVTAGADATAAANGAGGGLNANGDMRPVVAPPPGGASGANAGARAGEKTGEKTGAPLLWQLGQADLKAGRHQKALAPLGELARSYPKDAHAPYALLGLGMSQYKLKQYDEAAVTFNQVIEKHGKKKEVGIAWFGQAAAFLALKQIDDAKVLLEEVARRYPNSPEASAAKVALRKKTAPADLFATFPRWDKNAPQ